MAKKVSRDGTLELSADGVTYTAIGNILSVGYPKSTEEHDATDYDSGEYTESEKGHSSMSLSVSLNTNEADGGQALLPTAQDSDAAYYWRFRPTAGSGFKEYIFRGRPTGWSASDGAVRDILKATFSVNSTGALTVNTQ